MAFFVDLIVGIVCKLAKFVCPLSGVKQQWLFVPAVLWARPPPLLLGASLFTRAPIPLFSPMLFSKTGSALVISLNATERKLLPSDLGFQGGCGD